MARYRNGWYDYQMVKIHNGIEIGQILKIDDKSGSEMMFYVEGDHGTKDWFFADEIERIN